MGASTRPPAGSVAVWAWTAGAASAKAQAQGFNPRLRDIRLPPLAPLSRDCPCFLPLIIALLNVISLQLSSK
ncbi:hypothetical protein D3C78_1905880 [compost metagenome]